MPASGRWPMCRLAIQESRNRQGLDQRRGTGTSRRRVNGPTRFRQPVGSVLIGLPRAVNMRRHQAECDRKMADRKMLIGARRHSFSCPRFSCPAAALRRAVPIEAFRRLVTIPLMSPDSGKEGPMRPKGSRFPTTQWSAVVSAGCGGGSESGRCLAKLCEDYWFPCMRESKRGRS